VRLDGKPNGISRLVEAQPNLYHIAPRPLVSVVVDSKANGLRKATWFCGKRTTGSP
jgi:hypothetical protein